MIYLYDITFQLVQFLEFVFFGLVVGFTFDGFRAYRKIKKSTDIQVMIQDIIFFFLTIIFLVFCIVNFLESDIRVYIFLALFIGIIIYFCILSRLFEPIYIIIFKFIKNLAFIFVLPLNFVKELCKKIFDFLTKYIKNCCKKFFNIVYLKCILVKKQKTCKKRH